ncbi:MAG TPA: GDP-mannose 4,6-dehydratase [Candidatus Eisenbacteria bacterium]
MSTVLVTGASGFVGPHLARALRERGARVIGLAAEPQGAGLPVDGWHAADLLDPGALARAVAESAPDAVVHLAGQSSAARSFEQPVETFRLNVTGTWNLLEAVRSHAPRARVLVVGSGEVYGPQPEGSRAGEETPFRPVSPYALSKAAADALAELHARTHALDVVRTRSFGHTGPGQDPRFVVPSFARQIAAIERGGADPVLRVGNLEVVRDLADVRDVVRGYALLLERGRAGEAYNVCRGAGTRLADLARDLAARARRPVRIEVDPARMRPADVPWLVGDPAKLERDTGWRAEIPLERTLDDVMADWRARG